MTSACRALAVEKVRKKGIEPHRFFSAASRLRGRKYTPMFRYTRAAFGFEARLGKSEAPLENANLGIIRSSHERARQIRLVVDL
jgi:hypothetical protein